MDQQPHISDEEIFESWYGFTAIEPGFVGAMLKLLRDREGSTLEQQQAAFGVGDQEFRRLQSMLRPRPKSLPGDSNRIAEACNLKNPFAFVQAMVLASKLEHTRKEGEEFYQAAFDPETDLDQAPDEE